MLSFTQAIKLKSGGNKYNIRARWKTFGPENFF